MKAVRIRDFGGPDEIRVEEVDRPRPKERQLLLKVGGSSLNAIDVSVRSGELKWLTRFQLPKTLGFDLAGEVVACGAGVTGFVGGDRVVAMNSLAAGGAAEYCCVDERAAARIPDRLGWAEAAALPLAGATALQALRGIAHLREGQRVLINGASGGVGGFGVQIAKLVGAHVTAVCREVHFDHVRELGADVTVDYQKEKLDEIGERYDVVFDAAAKLDADQIKALLHHGGEAVTTRPQPKQVPQSIMGRLRGSFKLHFMMVKPRPNDFAFLLRVAAEGRLKACVAKTFYLAQATDAHRFFEDESFAGKVVLVMEEDGGRMKDEEDRRRMKGW